jgi:hypothetical protein
MGIVGGCLCAPSAACGPDLIGDSACGPSAASGMSVGGGCLHVAPAGPRTRLIPGCRKVLCAADDANRFDGSMSVSGMGKLLGTMHAPSAVTGGGRMPRSPSVKVL